MSEKQLAKIILDFITKNYGAYEANNPAYDIEALVNYISKVMDKNSN